MILDWLPILKKWVKNQFTEKNIFGNEFGVIKVSIDKDAFIIQLREDSVSDSKFTRFSTYFEGDKIRITNSDKLEYITLLEHERLERVCYQQGDLWDNDTTRWELLSMKEVTITEGFYFKKERIIGYDINLGDVRKNVAPCIDLMEGADVQLKF